MTIIEQVLHLSRGYAPGFIITPSQAPYIVINHKVIWGRSWFPGWYR